MNFLNSQYAQNYSAYTIGIRPEHLNVSQESGDWQGLVGVTEHLGSDTFFRVLMGDNTLTARVNGEIDVQHGDINESRLVLAESFGFTPIASGSDNLAALKQSVDLAVDATGVPAVAETLIDYTANGGNVLFFGVCPPGETIPVSPHDVFRRQIRIAGTHSLNHNIPEALQTIDSIGPDISRLISHSVELDEISGFLAKNQQQDSLKVQAVLSS